MRKAQFLELDVIIAVTLLLTSIIIGSQLYVHRMSDDRTVTYAQDSLNLLQHQKVKNLPPNLLATLTSTSANTNPDETIARQIIIYIIHNEIELAERIFQETLNPLIPANLGYNMSITSNNQQFSLKGRNVAEKNQLSIAKNLQSGLSVGKPITGYTGTLFITKGTHRLASSTYMGGFLGQGNITLRLDIPSDVTPLQFVMEGDFASPADIFVNGDYCSSIPTSGFVKQNFVDCLASLNFGANFISLKFSSSDIEKHYVAGGLLQVYYDTLNIEESSTKRLYLPEIAGIINVYDSLNIAGDLQSLSIRMHYTSIAKDNSTVFLALGNQTLYSSNESGEKDILITDNQMKGFFDYAQLSNQTVPLRLGYLNKTTVVYGSLPRDIVLITDVSGSMAWEMESRKSGERRNCDDPDINRTDTERLSVAKCATKDFTRRILTDQPHRVGTVSYDGTVDSTLGLTNDTLSIIEEIGTSIPRTGYDSGSRTCIACGIREAINLLASSERGKILVLLSDGEANRCYPDLHYSNNCGHANARDQAIAYAQDAYETYNISIYTISVGGEGQETLKNIAATDNITHYATATSASDLQEIYATLATSISSSSTYVQQVIVGEKPQLSLLHGDSVITYTTKDSLSGEKGSIMVSVATPQFNSPNCATEITIPQTLTPQDGVLMSYSGPHWTDFAAVNGVTVFNLTRYSSDYTTVGDPSHIVIPSGLLTKGHNTITLSTRDDLTTSSECSPANKLFYTGAIKSTFALDGVLPKATGCRWQTNILGTPTTIIIPKDYEGSTICTYLPSGESYDKEDAWHVLAHNFLTSYDVESDGIVDLDITTFELDNHIASADEVPYLWGPSIIEVDVWR